MRPFVWSLKICWAISPVTSVMDSYPKGKQNEKEGREKGRNWERQYVLGNQYGSWILSHVWKTVLMMWLSGGDKNICIATSVLWFREPFWISYLILWVWKQLTWKTTVPRVRNNPLLLKFWDFRQGHKSQSRGMLSSTPIMALSSMAITKYYPQPNNSSPTPSNPMVLIAHLSCWRCWLKRRPYFICCMGRHHLTLSLSQHKTKESREPTVGVQLSSGV